MKPNELSKTIADYRYSQGAAMKRRVDMANASQDEADDYLLLQLEHETEYEAVEGILVDMGFDGMEAVDTTLPLDDDGNEMVPMDRVHADHRSEHVIRAQLSLDKVRGLPERKDPLLLDVLSGRRHGDKRLALEQAESNRVSQNANSTEPQTFGGITQADLKPLIDKQRERTRGTYRPFNENDPIPTIHGDRYDEGLAKLHAYPLGEHKPVTLLERLWHKVATLFGIRMDP